MSRPSSTSTHVAVAPTVPQVLHILANPPPTLIDAQLPGYLLPPTFNLLRESSAHVIRKKKEEEDELRNEGLLPPLSEKDAKDESRLIEEELSKRIGRIGLMVGGFIAEKLTLARPPISAHLDIIKFICKDLFLYVYSKQIDNLRTNHRGVYVLQSNAFPPLVPLSSYKGSAADMDAANTHLIFSQALIQGALHRLGMNAVVSAESSSLPQCTFQIRTLKPSNIPSTPMSGMPNPQQTRQAPASVSAGEYGQPAPGSPVMNVTGSSTTGLGINQ
ncbi:transporter particle component [Cryptococcus neoformans Bt15]|nr:transporter particle component [Cryptococcus neoformans var. grubii Bt15]